MPRSAAQAAGEQACDQAAHAPIGGGMASGGSGYDEGIYLNTSRPYLLDSTTPGWTIWVDNYAGGTGSADPARVRAL